MATKLKIGILTLQGAFAEHEYCLQKCVECDKDQFQNIELDVVSIRKPSDLQGCRGLIIPGGESTTMAIFLKRNNFKELLSQWIHGKVYFKFIFKAITNREFE